MDTVHECDRQTDGQTDGQMDRITITKTVQRRASHGKNGSKLAQVKPTNIFHSFMLLILVLSCLSTGF